MSSTAEPQPRRHPVQSRSRDRVRLILETARAMVGEAGSDRLKMSDLAERSGISIGSLYQYFPDRRAVLAELVRAGNEEGRRCVAAILEPVRSRADFETALGQIVDGFHGMYLSDPVMRDVWGATQGDRALRQLDEEDCGVHAAMLAEAARRAGVGLDDAAARVLSVMLAAAVRHAITLPEAEADAAIGAAKRLLIRAVPG